ncbi:MAG: efflux RND transporter periplasmic adaptor subunit [Desulfuromonadales bacterium]|jgi:RND family efflux transporter MFP subunit|nr:efflux RND transporter periplasmic adaptor subunit [Desulfuromonadales bacterium]MDH3808233.1 efflux RND transporter periplasmic adaptor subunit [Desulfuromonadales bacterium]MDH3867735.1 efflux RND transporter periplasmic adaptor subunit [Desulfuromonadales bacterium]MDH4024609.1 efflux RND transporter periplasmic adaptor subunit [Desulfuromonadales bacterium]
MKNRLTRIITLLSLLPLLISLVACGDKEIIEKDDVRPIRAMEVADLEPFGGRWFPGQATATQEANMSFRVAGTVNLISVDLGDEVKQGDVIARLDPKDYQVELDNANAQLRRAISDLELAKSEYARVARVFEKDPGAVSKSMVDTRKAQKDSAAAQVESARATVERASDNLRYTYLKAPYDGVVVEKFVEQFEDVQAKQEIIRVLDNSSIEFTVQVPETLMEHVDKIRSRGAYVVFDTYPGIQVPAKVKEIGKEASKTTRTYPVTLIMNQPEDFKILPGMAGKAKGDQAATVEIAKEVGMVGFDIPITATFSDENKKTFVWVVDQSNNQVNKREVVLINLTEDGAMVTGLEKGETIATAGANLLVEGQQVRILK